MYMYTLPSLYTHAYTVISNASGFQESVYEFSITIYWEQFYNTDVVFLYSNIHSLIR